MKASTFFALMGGLAAGVVLGMMFAPENGEENRKKFRSKVDEFREKYCNENAEGAAAEAPAGEAEAPADE